MKKDFVLLSTELFQAPSSRQFQQDLKFTIRCLEQDACIVSLEKENYNKGQPTVRLQQVTQTLYRIIHM